MVAKPSPCVRVCLISIVLMVSEGRGGATQTLDSAGAPELNSAELVRSGNSARRQPWPLVHIPDPLARQATIKALEGAATRFGRPGCRKILSEFADGDGRPLADKLDSLSVDIQSYLTMVVFIDDTRHRRCASGALAFTVPGSRVVRVCVEDLKRTWQQQPDYVVAAFIHEVLHTLGLGENPPSSREITARVLAHCR